MPTTNSPAQSPFVMRMCARNGCPHEVTQNTTGRPGKYCSAACKQTDYRDRKWERDQQAERIAYQHAQEARFRQLVDVISGELDGSHGRLLDGDRGRRLSLTEQKARAHRIANAIVLTIGQRAMLLSENPNTLVRDMTTSELVRFADYFREWIDSSERKSRQLRRTLVQTLDVIDAEIERRSREAEARAATLP